jgi:acyl dehydratase
MPNDTYSLATIQNYVGQELGISDWLTIDQERIQHFADCTGDQQWIHVDVERATKESPFGAPIAHGFLTLSLIASWQMDMHIFPSNIAQAVNYGLNRVRFLTPVKVGARVRNRVILLSAEWQKNGGILLTTQNTVEIDGASKPALVAEMLSLLFPKE